MLDNLTDTFLKFEKYLRNSLATMSIAKITRVNPTTINCRLVTNKIYKGESIEIAEFTQVPVINMFGGATAIQMPLAIGDYCILLINESCFDAWYSGTDYISPIDVRDHDYSDAMAICGIKNKADELPIPTDGNIKVKGNLDITGNLTVTGTINCQDIIVNGISFNQHTHDGGTIGTGETGTPQ